MYICVFVCFARGMFPFACIYVCICMYFSFVQHWITALVGHDHGLSKHAAKHLAKHVRKKLNKPEMVRLAAYLGSEMVRLPLPLNCLASCMHAHAYRWALRSTTSRRRKEATPATCTSSRPSRSCDEGASASSSSTSGSKSRYDFFLFLLQCISYCTCVQPCIQTCIHTYMHTCIHTYIHMHICKLWPGTL